MAFYRQESWSGLPFPCPGNLPDPGIESMSPASSALQVDSLPAGPLGKPSFSVVVQLLFALPKSANVGFSFQNAHHS